MRLAGLLAVFMVVASLAGCGTMQARQGKAAMSDEERVAERALARWEALIGGNIEGAYGYQSPAYRSAVSLTMFSGRFGTALQWRRAVVDKVECEGDACNAVVMVTYYHPRFRFESTTALEERWIRIDNEWWRFDKF